MESRASVIFGIYHDRRHFLDLTEPTEPTDPTGSLARWLNGPLTR
jgi:hypothetical protein